MPSSHTCLPWASRSDGTCCLSLRRDASQSGRTQGLPPPVRCHGAGRHLHAQPVRSADDDVAHLPRGLLDMGLHLLALEPRLQEALVALEDIKRRRNLTEEELNQHYAFKMLLAYRG